MTKDTYAIRTALEPLLKAVSHVIPLLSWTLPWKVIPCDGKPIIASKRGGNLFQGYIATWQEADLIVAIVNALPDILSALASPLDREADVTPQSNGLTQQEAIVAWLRDDAGETRQDLKRLLAGHKITSAQAAEWENLIALKIAIADEIERRKFSKGENERAAALDRVAGMNTIVRPDDDALLEHLPESIRGAKRCGIQRSAWMTSWFVPWSPRNDNENAEGPWSDWVALANKILEADANALAALKGRGT